MRQSFLAILILFPLIAAACGSEGRPTESATQSRGTERGLAEVSQPNGRGRPLKGPTCTSAIVTLGSGNGAIDFAVRCFASSHGGRVGFSLGRASLRGHRSKPGIISIRRRPLVTGPGTVSSHGVCERAKEGIVCRAPARGRIVISGRIWVKARWRCAMGISVMEVESPRCTNGVCALDLRFRYLATGRPRGC
jgi:hypothetical protein